MTTVVTTSVSVTQLITEVPDVVAESIMNSVLTDKDITSNLLADLNYGFNHNMQRFINYGRQSYINGLPLTALIQGTSVDTKALFTAHIPAATGILVSRLGAPDPFHVVAHYLHTSPDWEMFPSSISTSTFNYVTGGNFSRNYSCRHIATNNTYNIDTSQGNYLHQGNNVHVDLLTHDSTSYGNFTLDFPVNYLATYTVYSITYEIPGGNFGLSRFFQHWIYDPKSGLIPELNDQANATSLTASYPIVPLRLDNENIVDNADTAELALSARELLKTINVDIDDVSTKIAENPDIAELDDAYIMFAADLNSSTDAAITYLYQYFKEVYYSGPRFSQAFWFANESNDNENIPEAANSRNYLMIRDNAVSIDVQFNYVTIEEKNGLIGDPQIAYDSSIIVGDTTNSNRIDPNNVIGAISKQIVLGTEQDNQDAQWYNNHVIIYRKQLTLVSNGDTSNTFAELVVHGLQHNITSVAKAGIVHRSLADMDDKGFFIPLSHDAVKLLNGVSEIELYQESLVFVAYSIQFTHLSFYEDAAFWEFIAFVIIVISLAYGAPELGEAIAAGVYATFVYIAEAYFYSIVIGEVFDLLIDAIGGDVALILAAIAFAFAVANGTDGTKYFDLISSEALMLFATRMTDAVNRDVVDDLLELQAEIESFETELEDAQDELDEAEKAFLNKTTKIELYALSSPLEYTDFTESPSAFYNRSIHMTNAVDLGRESISGYVDRLLTLPEPIRDTMRTV